MIDELDTDGTPSMAVIDRVAEVTGKSPLEMDPLYEKVDADALNALLGATEDSTTVSFSYCGCQVTAAPDGIQIDQPE